MRSRRTRKLFALIAYTVNSDFLMYSERHIYLVYSTHMLSDNFTESYEVLIG